MPVASRITKISTVAGLLMGTSMAILSAFNDAGAVTLQELRNSDRSQKAPATKEIKKLTAEQATARAAMALRDLYTLDKRFMQVKTNPPPGYKVADDRTIQEAMDKLTVSLEQGMNPNYLDPENGTSLFATAIWAAFVAERPDAVDAFIKNGADVKQNLLIGMKVPETLKGALTYLYGPVAIQSASPGQMPFNMAPPQIIPEPNLPANTVRLTPMDQALRALLISQTGGVPGAPTTFYRTESGVRAAAKIVRLMNDAGAKIEDAPTFANDERFRKSYDSFATTIVGMKVLTEEKLVKEQALHDLLFGPEDVRNEFSSAKDITEDLLKKHGAPVPDYRDARPGYPEPYTTKEGDTLQKLAARFVNAMNAASEKDALEKIAKENSLDVTTANTPIEKNKTIYIPVPPEHQIGQATLSETGFYTLMGVASRLQDAIGAATLEETIIALRSLNSIPEKIPGPFVLAGSPLSYPLKNLSGYATTTVQPLDTLRGFAANLAAVTDLHEKPGAHKQGTRNIGGLMQEIARMNELNIKDLETGKTVLMKDQILWFTVFNDIVGHVKPLKDAGNKGGKKMHLAVIEGHGKKDREAERDDSHGKMTYRDAAGTVHGLNKASDLSRIFRINEMLLSYSEDLVGTPANIGEELSMREISPSLHALLGRHDVIFTHSMGYGMPEKTADDQREIRDDDSLAYAGGRLLVDMLQDTYRSPTFSAAGNFRWTLQGGQPEGKYAQSHPTLHTRNSLTVGAAIIRTDHNPAGEPVIEDYSSLGGDVCVVIPKFQGESEHGTSSSTPVGAGIMKEMFGRYGGILTADEIITASMMVARRDVRDLDWQGGRFEWPKEKIAPELPMPMLFQKLIPLPAWFDVNGGGLPHHIRCGAGVLDADRILMLDEKLQEMAALKKDEAKEWSKTIEFGEPEIRNAKDKTTGKEDRKEYIYRATVPENLTLSRLTFMVPQRIKQHSDVFIKTPAGFEKELPRSYVDIVSTSAFAIEDVKKGDIFEIRTEQPLGKTAGMILRGWENGGKPDDNIIQIMRNKLRAEGILPTPLTFLVGGKVVESKTEEADLRKQNRQSSIQPLGKRPGDEDGQNPAPATGRPSSPALR